MRGNFIWGIVIGLILGIVVGWMGVTANTTTTIPAVTKTTITQKQQDLRMNMRKLWEDHITWTRMFLISAAYEHEDIQNVTARLLKNQEDIGNAVKPYYGNDSGNRLTSLLKEHITLAVDIVEAAKANNQQALNTANTKWYSNANQIADFLSSANPNWSRNDLRSMLKNHLDLTKQEAVDIISRNFDADIVDYDRIHNQILTMADVLSNGIIKQFPDAF